MSSLGNDYRFVKMGFLLAVIICLCVYSYLDNSSEHILKECIRSPDTCKGKTLDIGFNTKTGTVGKGSYELLTRYGNFRVKGKLKPAHSNQYVNVILRISERGEFETEKIYIRRYRLIKIVVSTVPALIVLIFFFRKFSFNLKTWLFVSK